VAADQRFECLSAQLVRIYERWDLPRRDAGFDDARFGNARAGRLQDEKIGPDAATDGEKGDER
jgi:hypothetical protein